MRSRRFCVTVALALLAAAATSTAAPICPAEVKEARELLTAKAAVAQRPKSQAGARGQETQAPREQEIQAPRGQETQAPRGQEAQAPRNAVKGRAAALANARRLVIEAEAACKDADSARATSNARAAIELLKYLP
ncbi:MAG TPA: hypothetical protein VN646_19110 [Candidatus Acidoferrum sp.]|jgi:hypothetical protein|nr:hypothetical protein [Candidatus Acidoferrum sp.]